MRAPAATVTRRGLLPWLLDLILLAGFVVLTVALARGHLLTLDERVADWAGEHRPTPLYVLLRVLNYLGQGGQVLMPIALLLAGLVAWRRRSVRPLLVFAAVFVLTYVTIGPLKIWLDRAAPAFDGPDRLVLFNPHASGIEALQIMEERETAVDLVVSDVVMPEMDGPTLLRELRKRYPDLKVIFVSGYAEDAFKKNLPEGEPFNFLPKPFSLKQLVETVKQTLAA